MGIERLNSYRIYGVLEVGGSACNMNNMVCNIDDVCGKAMAHYAGKS